MVGKEIGRLTIDCPIPKFYGKKILCHIQRGQGE